MTSAHARSEGRVCFVSLGWLVGDLFIETNTATGRTAVVDLFVFIVVEVIVIIVRFFFLAVILPILVPSAEAFLRSRKSVCDDDMRQGLNGGGQEIVRRGYATEECEKQILSEEYGRLELLHAIFCPALVIILVCTRPKIMVL